MLKNSLKCFKKSQRATHLLLLVNKVCKMDMTSFMESRESGKYNACIVSDIQWVTISFELFITTYIGYKKAYASKIYVLGMESNIYWDILDK